MPEFHIEDGELLPSAEANRPRPGLFSRTMRVIAGNSMEFTATALEIASEIAVFVGGMGFFIVPPLKGMYAKLKGNNISYAVIGRGLVCIETSPPKLTDPSVSLPPALSTYVPLFDNNTNTIFCNSFNDLPLTSSNVTFNVGYPDSLFSASILLVVLGTTGSALARALQSCGHALYSTDRTLSHSKAQAAFAKKMNNPLLALYALLFLGSRVAALYATTTISLVLTLKNVPGILQDFSISAPGSFAYYPENNVSSTASEQAVSYSIKAIKATVEFITKIDFTLLRMAAKNGSEEIKNYYFPLSIMLAGVGLILGFAALKAKQKRNSYIDTLQRDKYYQERSSQLEEANSIIDAQRGQIQDLKTQVKTPSLSLFGRAGGSRGSHSPASLREAGFSRQPSQILHCRSSSSMGGADDQKGRTEVHTQENTPSPSLFVPARSHRRSCSSIEMYTPPSANSPTTRP